MTKITGRTGTIGYALESPRGSKTAPTYWVKGVGVTIQDMGDTIDEEGIIADTAGPTDQTLIRTYSNGNIGGNVYIDPMGVEMSMVYGAKPTPTKRVGLNLYDHVYTWNKENSHPTISVVYKDPKYAFSYALGTLDSYNLVASATANQFVNRTMALMGKKSTQYTGTPSAPDNSQKFILNNIFIKFAASRAGLASAAVINAVNFNKSITKGAELLYGMGAPDLNPIDSINGASRFAGSMSVYYENQDYYDTMFGDTPKAMEVKLTNGASGVAERSITYTYDKVKLSQYNRPRENTTAETQSFNWTAINTGANAYACKITNTKASY